MTTENQLPVAVITGSSSGIGRQTAIEFGRAGYHVMLHARGNLLGLQESARLIQQMVADGVNTERTVASKTDGPVLSSRSTRCITADIASPAACRDFVQTAFAWHERVDVWVNNAGADLLTTEAHQLPFEQQLQLLLDVDLRGTVRLSRLVVDQMRQRQVSHGLPAVINVGWDQSELGMEGEPGQLFGTTKAAVAAFTRSLAMSVAPDVRVNCVAPGWIKTEWGTAQASAYWDRRAKTESLLCRWGAAGDVARTIVWLASKNAEFVNGQTIQINGGRRFSPIPDQKPNKP